MMSGTCSEFDSSLALKDSLNHCTSDQEGPQCDNIDLILLEESPVLGYPVIGHYMGLRRVVYISTRQQIPL